MFIPVWGGTYLFVPCLISSPHIALATKPSDISESAAMRSRVALAATAFVLAAAPCWQAPPLGQEASPVPFSSGLVPTSTAAPGPNPNDDLVFGEIKVPRWLAETVARAAQVTNVDPAYLMALADKESSVTGANSRARAKLRGWMSL